MRALPGILLLLSAHAAAQVKVTYLANEGVLLEAGQDAVLIDALFRDSLDDYVRHTATVQEQLETGKPPFHRVKLALATHFHLDHWDAGSISRFLRLNPDAVFASTPEGVAMIPSSLRSRARGLAAGNGPSGVSDIGAVRVDAIPLRHGATRNLAFRVVMGGRTVMHLGDAETVDENFQRLAAEPPPDLLIVPFWWLLNSDSASFLRSRWRPRAVAAAHFSTMDGRQSAGRVRDAMPAAWTCTRAGESRTY